MRTPLHGPARMQRQEGGPIYKGASARTLGQVLEVVGRLIGAAVLLDGSRLQLGVQPPAACRPPPGPSARSRACMQKLSFRLGCQASVMLDGFASSVTRKLREAAENKPVHTSCISVHCAACSPLHHKVCSAGAPSRRGGFAAPMHSNP